jgi:RNase P/RNase MRP subunit POP5
MVRHKTRWLLLKVEDEGGEEEGQEEEAHSSANLLSKKDVSKAIRDNFEALMGLHGATASFELHGRPLAGWSRPSTVRSLTSHLTYICLFYHGFDVFSPVRFWDASQTKLLLLRVPRDFAGSVRSSLAFLALIRGRHVALLNLSVHGSARTAKIAAIRRVRAFYRDRILRLRRQPSPLGSAKARAEANRLCTALENRLLTLQTLDF